MPNTTVTEAWGVRVQRWVLSVLLVMLVFVVVLAFVRLFGVIQLYSDHVRLQTEFDILKDRVISHERQSNERLDIIERTVFGDILFRIDSKVPKNLTNDLQWLENRNRDLRERITVLERWRWEKEKVK